MVNHPLSPVSFIEGILLTCHVKKVRDNVLKTFSRKIRALDGIRDSVETLVLGSSHAQMGWAAKPGEFNLGMAYQDLYYTYNLYRRYADGAALKKVVVFYSVFSQGSQLILTRDARTCATFKVVSGIEWEDVAVAEALHLARLCPAYRRKAREFLVSHAPMVGDLGNERDYVPIAAGTANVRALAHFKNSHRADDMTRFLAQLVNEAEKRGHKVYIVIPPATIEYRREIPCGDEIFGGFKNAALAWKNVTVFDHYEDARFSSDDFIDWDHSSFIGARKLTEMVRKEIEDGSKIR